MKLNVRDVIQRLQRLEHQGEPEGGYSRGDVVGGPGYALLTDEPLPRCDDPYHRSVIGIDGVVRQLMPSGNSREVKPCPWCEAG